MASKAYAYAFLRATLSDTNGDPIRALVPIVRRSIIESNDQNFSEETIYEINKRIWGLDLPILVVRFVMNLLRQKNEIIKITNDHIYKSNISYQESNAIKQLENATKIEMDYILSEIDSIKTNHFNKISNHVKALPSENIISAWLEININSQFHGTKSDFNSDQRDIGKIIAIGVSNTSDNNRFSDALTNICLGDVLFQTIKSVTEYEHIDDVSSSQKMQDVSVFLDTGIILSFLGYNTPQRQKVALEFVEICRSAGCNLHVFGHTLEEIGRIFSAAARNPRPDGQIASAILSRGLQPRDLDLLAIEMPKIVSDHGFAVVDAPSVLEGEGQNSVDEVALERRFVQEIKQENPEARLADMQSVTAIHRIRDGLPALFLEKCKAIFVTTNGNVALSSTRFFSEYFRENGDNNRVQHCMTDVVFCSRIWTKLPTRTNAPRTLVIAKALNNLRPSDNVLREFNDYIVRLAREGTIKTDVEWVLNISQFKNQALALNFGQKDKNIETREFLPIIADLVRRQNEIMGIEVEKSRTKALDEIAGELDKLRSKIAESEIDRHKSINEIDEKNKTIKKISLIGSFITRLLNISLLFFIILVPIFISIDIFADFTTYVNIFTSLTLAILTISGLSLTGILRKIDIFIIRHAMNIRDFFRRIASSKN